MVYNPNEEPKEFIPDYDFNDDYSFIGKIMVETARSEGWVEADVIKFYRCDNCVSVIEFEHIEEHNKWHASLKETNE